MHFPIHFAHWLTGLTFKLGKLKYPLKTDPRLGNETPGSCCPLKGLRPTSGNLLRTQVLSVLDCGVRFKFTVVAVQPWASQPHLSRPQYTHTIQPVKGESCLRQSAETHLHLGAGVPPPGSSSQGRCQDLPFHGRQGTRCLWEVSNRLCCSEVQVSTVFSRSEGVQEGRNKNFRNGRDLIHGSRTLREPASCKGRFGEDAGGWRPLSNPA